MPNSPLPAGTVFLLDMLQKKRALLFRSASREIVCRELREVPDFLREVETARAQGAHVAGFLAYELGYAFEPKLRERWQRTGDLLGWFGVYDAPETLSLSDAEDLLAAAAGNKTSSLGPPEFDMTSDQYGDAFAKVRDHLAKGDIFQVNLTIRASLRHEGSPEALFLRLMRNQPVAHAAYLHLEDRAVLSLSPELFLEREGKILRTRPMKGTAPRGLDEDGDQRIACDLASDPKQRAENTMIVDLMRNDLSRISVPGSVQVTKLCDVERYQSLFQMTSTIEAELEEDVEFSRIIENLFPCGSITGAPKLSAMLIADRLETSPRGIYTGSIGHIEPSGDFAFNVAIRTLDLRKDGRCIAGTGSGVVFDSGAGPEYDECKLKLSFISRETKSFELLETLAWMPNEGFVLLERHLARLASSARYFAYDFDRERLCAELTRRAEGWSGPQRIRVLLGKDGGVSISAAPLVSASDNTVWHVRIASQRTRSDDVFLYHKTTNRAFYDDTRQQMAAESGCDEVLFVNEAGYLTEGSFTSLFVAQNGRLLTPGLRHGLLPGTFRAGLLEQGIAVEADLRREDLGGAKVFVGNSVRGLIPVTVIS
ncbi:aminodeoxychorismate synthase component I [Roseibium suaedae]|uniref:Probable branched-chain-amino-acid aminotransferase n=1 Tax=Roseibium suaedae TaxID=735517 RepID=A0A1M6ZTV2_9HYPH|nr:aminodeoxychorismate synthase component I [Roseibium suaedae]SHL33854.1 para-aminobenzoate synthetase / 4-amino-4-deoxychorismate lyase [Roseibium suaedae]